MKPVNPESPVSPLSPPPQPPLPTEVAAPGAERHQRNNSGGGRRRRSGPAYVIIETGRPSLAVIACAQARLLGFRLPIDAQIEDLGRRNRARIRCELQEQIAARMALAEELAAKEGVPWEHRHMDEARRILEQA